ncbi:MAG: leucine--tRNA ligase [Candidatus Altimarinota bacterium]
MPNYKATETEAKWQGKWKDTGLYKVNFEDKSRPKYYNLVMFPYPSGAKLHIGHWYNFGPADSWGRYMRLRGFNVFEPMGYDSFGLPAENYAIKTGVPPQQSIEENTKTMTEQLSLIGTMYDWSKTLKTSEPEYYKWTQWVFLKLYEKGLAYQKEAYVNWDPVDQTVLANEQVLPDGTAERSGAKVEQKLLKQWFFKISDYSQKLLDGLDNLDWPEKTKLMQRNWIGRSEGAQIRFEVEGGADSITVFTTRPDTIFGATYLVVAPENPILEKIVTAEQREAVEQYRREVGSKSELQRTDLAKDKSGVFSGGYVINPANGKKLPIWIADYVLMTYGTGAIMAVPAHDERDFEFAKKFKLEILPVVEGEMDLEKTAFTEDGKAINSEFLNGLSTQEAKEKMFKWLEEKGFGKQLINYRLRDWLLSRQRYWGAPIPIVYDPEGKAHQIPAEHLPWTLPTDIDFKPTGTSPLGQSKELLERTEKIFGKGWKPEIDTMDTFVCSSFYYLRYLMEGAGDKFVDAGRVDEWMPVDMYIGGPEHACMHLIYARFVMMALKDCGIVKHGEPFKKLVHQGLITNSGAKMSKSKGNVVSPDEYVNKYGSDVFRMYLMFMGPYAEGGDWNDSGISGVVRFAERFYNLVGAAVEVKDQEGMLRSVNKVIKKVSTDIEKFNFNTCIAALMEFVNETAKVGLDLESRKKLTILIAPFAPHLAEELWALLGEEYSVFNQTWPSFDDKYLVMSSMKIAIQVNGKLRGEIEIEAGEDEKVILEKAKKEENVAKYLEEGELIKEIYVKGKLVSLVVKN